MNKLFIFLLFLASNANATLYFDFETNQEDEIETSGLAESTFENYEHQNDVGNDKSTSIDLIVSAGVKQAKLDLTMNQTFESSGKNAAQILESITNISNFNAMAEKVRSTESGAAFQNTIKAGSDKDYTLTTEAWGFKDVIIGKVKINAGSSRVRCVKSQPTSTSFALNCSKDTKHAGTNKMLASSNSALVCTQNTATLVTCQYRIVMEPYEFSLYTKYMTGNEVAFRSSMRAIRTNMGLFNMIAGKKNANDAYNSYNTSEIEKKLTQFNGLFSSEKNIQWNFKY
ncbi:MAG: hypothetical protein ACOYL6_14415 [Bacteriovoracaceae bacterium]